MLQYYYTLYLYVVIVLFMLEFSCIFMTLLIQVPTPSYVRHHENMYFEEEKKTSFLCVCVFHSHHFTHIQSEVHGKWPNSSPQTMSKLQSIHDIGCIGDTSAELCCRQDYSKQVIATVGHTESSALP